MNSFNKEDKVTMEELAPSLKTKITDAAEGIEAINKKISSLASETNKALSSSEIDEKINAVSAFPIYKDAHQNNFETRAELMSATVFYGADGKVRIPTNNDYTFVHRDETHNNHLCRYVFNSGVWAFQIEVNFNILEGGTGINITNEVINHNNSVAAVTTETLMKIKYDTEGHITGNTEVFVDTSVTKDSDNLITSGAVQTALDNKQDKLSEAQLDAVNSGINNTKVTNYEVHIADFNNPHSTTKEHIGLSNVDNTADIDKPISAATQLALDLKQDKLSDTQLSAVNSGITSSKVSTYDGYATTKQDKLPDAANIGQVLKSTNTTGGVEWGDMPASAVWGNITGTLSNQTDLNTALNNKADKATTLSGYGITDANINNGTITLGTNTITPITSHQDISGKQDKLSDTQLSAVNSGITSSKVSTYDGYATTISGKADKATTLSGYGITDANINNGTITLGTNTITPITSHQPLKTINNQSIIGSGNIEIGGGGGSGNVDDVRVNGTSVVNNKVANINTNEVLGLIVNSSGLLCVEVEE